MYKIAIIGSQSTGKTTIANQLSEKLNIPMITELARKWDIEKATQTELIHIQKELLKLQIDEENRNEQFISDRSTIDNLSYWLHNVSPIVDKEENELYVNTALKNVKNYSHIFLLTPEFYPVDDDFRNTNIIYQLQIAEVINTILRLYNIPHYKLTRSVENRVQKAMEILIK
jgi:nicotinamide riboside kinase